MCIAMHVRHGDACRDVNQSHRKCLPLSRHLRDARRLAARYAGGNGNAAVPYRYVYIATDDEDVALDLAARRDAQRAWRLAGSVGEDPGGLGGLVPVWQATDRHVYTKDAMGGNIDDATVLDNDATVIRDLYRDMWAMALCEGFVGSMASSMAWVTLGLQLARLGRYPPFIAVDGLAYVPPACEMARSATIILPPSSILLVRDC